MSPRVGWVSGTQPTGIRAFTVGCPPLTHPTNDGSDRIGGRLSSSRHSGESMLEAPTGVQTPDEILVQRARERDPGAREELFQRYRGDAFRVAYRLLGHEQDAMD